MALKEDLRKRRLELNLTMAEVAKRVGVSEATISRWESGDIENMRRDKIVLLAEALQVTPGYIMGFEDTPEPAQDSLANDYFSLARNAQEEGLDPEDIQLAIDMIRKLKKKDTQGD